MTPLIRVSFVSAAHLYSIAQAAVERLADAPSDRDSNHPDACVAIVFAAACLEAFANELGYIAREQPQSAPGIGTLGEVLEELEPSASVKSKFLLIRGMLGGSPYNKGVNPYQDFALLIALRNELVHRKAESYDLGETGAPLTTHSLLDKLRSKNIIAEPRARESQVWSFLLGIETRGVAKWAVETAAAMMRDIAAVAPSDFRIWLQARYALILGPPAG